MRLDERHGRTLNVRLSPIPTLKADILDVELNVSVCDGINRLFQRFQVFPLQVFERMSLSLAQCESKQEIASRPDRDVTGQCAFKPTACHRRCVKRAAPETLTSSTSQP